MMDTNDINEIFSKLNVLKKTFDFAKNEKFFEDCINLEKNIDDLLKSFHDLFKLHMRRRNERFSSENETIQFSQDDVQEILYILCHLPGESFNNKELMELTNGARTSVSNAIGLLEKKNMILLKRSPTMNRIRVNLDHPLMKSLVSLFERYGKDDVTNLKNRYNKLEGKKE